MGLDSPREQSKSPMVRRLYGRRRGHKLRSHQSQLVDELLPKLQVPLNRPGLSGLDLFDADVEDIWLEVGFGAGEHLTAQVAQNPKIGMIGCEPFLNGMASLLSDIEERRLTRIRTHMGDARDLLDVLAPESIGRAFLLYPDPWPKKKHHKRRFVSQESLDQLMRVLKPGAFFKVATDIPDYCRWTLAHIRRHGGFDWLAEGPQDWRLPPPDWTRTRYEAKAVAAGRTPIYLTFRRQ